MDSLPRLTEGSGYSERQGRATVALIRLGDMLEATATCDSMERVVELYEELFLEAGATADSLRAALTAQTQTTVERRSNAVRPVIIAFILGLAAGGILTFYLIKRYGRK